MKKIALLFLTVFGLYSSSALSAQDVIIMKDGTKHEVKIREITDNVIKYNDYRDIDGIIFTMSRGLISEIQYEFGKNEIEREPIANELFFIDDRRNNLKFSFTSLASNVLSLTYERSINPSSSFETTLKIHGVGFEDNFDDKSGFGLNLGYKFKFSNLFSAGQGYRPGHILSGGYLRPNMGFDLVNFGNTFFRDESYDLYHFGVDFGIQWVLRNSVSLEIFGGPHYYTRNGAESRGDFFNDDPFANGEFFGLTNGFGASFGFRMGLLFGKKKETVKRARK